MRCRKGHNVPWPISLKHKTTVCVKKAKEHGSQHSTSRDPGEIQSALPHPVFDRLLLQELSASCASLAMLQSVPSSTRNNSVAGSGFTFNHQKIVQEQENLSLLFSAVIVCIMHLFLTSMCIYYLTNTCSAFDVA